MFFFHCRVLFLSFRISTIFGNKVIRLCYSTVALQERASVNAHHEVTRVVPRLSFSVFQYSEADTREHRKTSKQESVVNLSFM